MPIRAYEPVKSPCRLCGPGFDLMQETREPALTECPRCGASVRLRTVAPANSPRLLKPLSPSAARNAGFSVFKRTAGGDFEKL